MSSASELNIKLTVAYDGGRYLGWQKTRMGPSIEECLENVLEKIFQESITLQAASRTDAGVHADAQIVNFIISKPLPSLDRLRTSLNALLPKDISILLAEKVEISFHPTLNSQGKEYYYKICYEKVQLPKERHYSWHYPVDLNIAAMKQAAELLVGEHDFSAFCNYKKTQKYAHFIRNIEKIEIEENGDKRLTVHIKGNNFLYKMVRNIVGTLVYVGCGKLKLDDIPEILKTKKRLLAGVTAPAHGLTLSKVHY